MNIDTGKDGDRIEGLDRLARSRAPSRDLWPGIEARLAPRRSRYPLMQFALAASLVAGMAGVFTQQQPQPPQPPMDSAQAAPLQYDSRAIVVAHLSMVKHAERELRQALKQTPDSQPLRSLLASTENRARDLRALL